MILEGTAMKKNFSYVALAALLFGGCREVAELNPSAQHRDGVYASIEQPDGDAQTKGLAFADGKLTFSWSAGDQLMVYGNTTAAVLAVGEGGSDVTKLESPDFILKEGVTYHIFSPVAGTLSDVRKDAVNVSFDGQRQTANSSTEHLRYNQYAAATADVKDNAVNFQLLNQVAWIRYSRTFADGLKGVVKVVLCASEGEPFVLNGTLDATAAVSEKGFKTAITPVEYTGELSLALGDENGIDIAAGETLNAFFTVHPVNLTGKKITFKLLDANGNVLEQSEYDGVAVKRNAAVTFAERTSAGASVNGVSYSTVAEAIKAASDGAVVKVLSDAATGLIPIANSVVVDLDGHTLTCENDDVFKITADGLSVTFKNGNIVSKKYGGLFFKAGLKNEDVTFENCNVTGVEGAIATSTLTGSTITIEGGTYTSSNNAVILTNGSVREGEPNTIYIMDGTFRGQMGEEAYTQRNAIACGIYAAWKDNIFVFDGSFEIERGVGVLCRGGNVAILGGTFKTTDPDNRKGRVGDSREVVPCQTLYVDKYAEYPDAENATIWLRNGKFSDDSCKDYLESDYTCELKDGFYEVYSELTSNTNKITESLRGKNATASVEDNVKVNTIYSNGENAVLELKNGAVMTGVDQYVVYAGRSMSLTGDGKIVSECSAKAKYAAALKMDRYVTVDISDNVTLEGGSGKNANYAACLVGGTLNIHGGYFHSSNTSDGTVIYLESGKRSGETPVVNIDGGVFETDGKPENIIRCNVVNSSIRGTVNIKGGIFVGWNPAEGSYVKDGVEIKWIPEGYTSIETTYKGKTAWKVIEKN